MRHRPILISIFLSGALLATGPVISQEAVPTGKNSIKVAVIDVRKVVSKSIMGQKMSKEIQQEQAEQQKRLAAMKKDFADLQKRLEEESSVLSADALLELRQKARRKARQIQSFRDDADTGLQEKTQAFLAKLERKIRPVIAQYCKEQGIDLVLDAQSIVFARTTLDITDAILERFDKSVAAVQPSTTKP